MVKAVKFAYVMLLVLSALLVSNTVDAAKCVTDADCPSNTPGVPYTWICYKSHCYNTKNDTPEESVPIN
ncbi:hypothetical protein P8452_43209 [Trifolium repens]|nr:hypothetical protein P8452_43209 [Trifolium repens]